MMCFAVTPRSHKIDLSAWASLEECPSFYVTCGCGGLLSDFKACTFKDQWHEDGGSAITSYGVYVATSAGGGGRTLVLEAAATGGLQAMSLCNLQYRDVLALHAQPLWLVALQAAELPEIEQPQDSSYSYVV
eukprot:3324458-Amphidinium_carterae.1